MERAVSVFTVLAFVSVFLLAFNINAVKAEGLIGDVNDDGVVNLKDLFAASSAFGSTVGSPKWNAQADVNNDGKVDTLDFYIIASHFGERTAPPITLIVHICPRSLNLRSKGRWITAYIKLPKGYNASGIDASTIMLNSTIPPESRPIAIKGCLGTQALIVKFDRQKVIDLILREHKPAHRFETITLTITGRLGDGAFQGSDRIRVILRSSCRH